jgi:hypothetical protein
MPSRFFLSIVVVAALVSFARPCWAGMGAPTLEDLPRVLTLTNIAKARIDAVSFFAVGLFGIAWAIRTVWNSLAKDFPRLPRISYWRSLGLMGLWGLLFLLVLTMISGARELMTPGAWKKNGITYQLVEPDNPPARPVEISATRRNDP